MTPTIGLMVGFYIMTRMFALVSRTGERAESALVKIFAVITVLVALWGIVTLLSSGAELTRSLG